MPELTEQDIASAIGVDHREIVRERDWDLSDLSSLTGKVALVTGAGSWTGIGANIAHQLALLGAKVYVHARSELKAKAGIDGILSRSPSVDAQNLKPFVTDISDYHGVKAAAERLLSEEDRLDILVNNAAIMGPKLEYDQLGVNSVMATNHLGPFLLTKLLLPLLEKTAKQSADSDVRIVNVASTGNYVVPPTMSFTSLKEWNDAGAFQDDIFMKWLTYCYKKSANVLYAKELQKRLDDDGANIVVTSVHPGQIMTPGWAGIAGFDSEEYKTSLSPAEGALAPLWCAAHPEARQDKFRGRFVMPYGALKPPMRTCESDEEAKGLWAVSEELLQEILHP